MQRQSVNVVYYIQAHQQGYLTLQVVYAGQNGGCYGGEDSEKLYDNIGNSDFTDRGNIICDFGNNMEVCGYQFRRPYESHPCPE